MAIHLNRVEENEALDKALSTKDIYDFLDGKDVDDSKVYKVIQEETIVTEEVAVVSLLDRLIKESENAKERSVKVIQW
jgi:hypothetical protein